MNIETASDVEEQVAGPKIASSPPFTPALSASKKLQPLHQPPLLQTFQEPEFKELDDPEVYYNFADVLQILRPLVGWWGANSICIAVFLDDGWSVAYYYNSAKIIDSRVRSDLHQAGLQQMAINQFGNQQKIITWLGLV